MFCDEVAVMGVRVEIAQTELGLGNCEGYRGVLRVG